MMNIHRPLPILTPRPRAAITAVLWGLGLVALLLASCAKPPADEGMYPADVSIEELEYRYRAAVEREPGNAELNLELAGVLARQGKGDEAVAYYDRAVELDARFQGKARDERRRHAERQRETAKQLLETGDPDGARVQLASARAMVPADPETIFLEGRLAEAVNDGPAAVAAYREAWSLDPGDRKKKEALAGALMAVGRAEYENGNYRVSWESLDEAAELTHDGELHYLRGAVAYAWAQQTEDPERIEHLDQAARAFRSVLEESADDDDARFNLGAVLLAAGRYEEAAQVYRSLIARNPMEGDLYMALARTHGYLGQSELLVTEEAIGRALRVGDPVDDPGMWARRSADRFPGSDLAYTYFESLAPDAVYTYTLPGGGLVEVWFYRTRKLVETFREGARLGPTFVVPER